MVGWDAEAELYSPCSWISLSLNFTKFKHSLSIQWTLFVVT